MKILAPVGSQSGWTMQIGEWIADELTTLGHEVTLVRALHAPSAAGYDAVLIGAGIRAGNWNGDALEWLKDHVDDLKELPFATFTSSLVPSRPNGEGEPEANGYTAKVMTDYGLTSRAHKSFAGGYDPARVTLPERLIMRAMNLNKKVDYLDENAVREWTREVVEKLG